MKYTLPNGRVIDLVRVLGVSPVRDMGPDSRTIDQSRIGFVVHMDKREVVEVTDTYHFTDWPVAKNKMKKVREELLVALEKRKAAC